MVNYPSLPTNVKLPKVGDYMDSDEFKILRKKLNKTQDQLAQLLGISLKAIQSYEQGWRKIPVYVERQLLFITSRMRNGSIKRIPCWTAKKCPSRLKKKCPAWEFRSGTLCWFINGTICEGEPQKNWKEKMRICRKCDVFRSLLYPPEPEI